jgi:hypothetical protein
MTTITILLGHWWWYFQARSKKASAFGHIAFLHGIKNGVSKSLLPRVGILSQERRTNPVMGLQSRKGNLRVSNPEKKQVEACLGDWRLLILTNPESRYQLSSLTI